MSRNDYYGWYTKTTPIGVKGGIKSQSKSGAFVKKWWGKRWIEVLESFDIGARLQRGRSYARSGQVTKLEITKGNVDASVQGSSYRPYLVNIHIGSFSEEYWQKVIDKLNEQSLYITQLIANEMPNDIEQVFASLDLSLFPAKKNDMTTKCSCPDSSNPCKHIAAVYYLMSEAFDNDPFLIFKLRGMDRDNFMSRLNKGIAEEEDTSVSKQELPLDLNAFWGNQEIDYNYSLKNSTLPSVNHAIIPQRLGNLAFWRSEMNFQDTMKMIYTDTTQNVLDIYEQYDK